MAIAAIIPTITDPVTTQIIIQMAVIIQVPESIPQLIIIPITITIPIIIIFLIIIITQPEPEPELALIF